MLDFRPYTEKLLQDPGQVVSFSEGQHEFELSFVIPDYAEQIAAYYSDLLPQGLQARAEQHGITFTYQQFALQIRFQNATELNLHDHDMQLDPGIKALADRFGPVIFKNAYLSTDMRSMGHRNRFPHLSFHVDRSVNQPTPYSMYTRDPFDAEQLEPRTASTLITSNIVGLLQCIREKQCNPSSEQGVRTQYNLFAEADMSQVLDKLVLNQSWSETRGTGEIVVQDNRTMLHASYYRDASRDAYRIGVRYVG